MNWRIRRLRAVEKLSTYFLRYRKRLSCTRSQISQATKIHWSQQFRVNDQSKAARGKRLCKRASVPRPAGVLRWVSRMQLMSGAPSPPTVKYNQVIRSCRVGREGAALQCTCHGTLYASTLRLPKQPPAKLQQGSDWLLRRDSRSIHGFSEPPNPAAARPRNATGGRDTVSCEWPP